MPGKSFLQLLKGDTTQWRNKIFYEYYCEYDFPMTPTVYGVRTDKYKYIRYMGVWDQNELYDLEKDPGEMHNLIEDPQYADLVKNMAGDLLTGWNLPKECKFLLNEPLKILPEIGSLLINSEFIRWIEK